MEETGREQEGDQQTEESNASEAPPVAGEATEGPPWCVFSSPFAPEKVGSGMGWMDEQDKYGPPLVAMFGEEGAASGSNRQKVGDGSIVAALREATCIVDRRSKHHHPHPPLRTPHEN